MQESQTQAQADSKARSLKRTLSGKLFDKLPRIQIVQRQQRARPEQESLEEQAKEQSQFQMVPLDRNGKRMNMNSRVVQRSGGKTWHQQQARQQDRFHSHV